MITLRVDHRIFKTKDGTSKSKLCSIAPDLACLPNSLQTVEDMPPWVGKKSWQKKQKFVITVVQFVNTKVFHKIDWYVIYESQNIW